MILEIILPREIFLHCLFWYNFNKCTLCEIISSFHPGSGNEIQFLSQCVEHSSWAHPTSKVLFAVGFWVRTNNPLGVRWASGLFPVGRIMATQTLSSTCFVISEKKGMGEGSQKPRWPRWPNPGSRLCTQVWPQTRNLFTSPNPWLWEGWVGL